MPHVNVFICVLRRDDPRTRPLVHSLTGPLAHSPTGPQVFEGCLVVVSHDNFFVNRVAEHLFVFKGDGVVRDFLGSYTEYLESRRDEMADAAKAGRAAARPSGGGSDGSSGSANAPSTAPVAASLGASTSTGTGISNKNSAAVTAIKAPKSVSGTSAATATSTAKDKSAVKGASAVGGAGGVSLSFAERKEMNKLEKEVAKLGTQVTACVIAWVHGWVH